jgi:hypothetical protein
MTELDKQLNRLREAVSKAQKVENLVKTEGWDFVRGEIEKMLVAFKEASVSPKALENQIEHATIVGGHNALKSLLETLDHLQSVGPRARARLQETELANREELERAGK